MSNSAITAEGIGKQFKIGLDKPVRNLGARIGGLFKPDRAPKEPDTFWALRDVSFDVGHGDVIGIVGRNGAGKSTLLKVLSRITGITEGRVEINGNIGSLLEVGTGFHPELTGRENVFLNGAILGMSKGEVRRKFDEIVAFSEVAKFLDTPVKRYSSGMYTRLAFAVAAHLEPEILIVDEVLAVGDAEFQRKCLGKMQDVGREGRTVFFVSHNMGAVDKLCNCALMLEAGRVKTYSRNVSQVTREYLFGEAQSEGVAMWSNDEKKYANAWFTPTAFYLCDENGQPTSKVRRNDAPVSLRIEGDIEQLDPALTVGYEVYSQDGDRIFRTYHSDTAEEQWPALHIGHNVLHTSIPAHFLNEGEYRVELMVSLHKRHWITEPGQNAPAVFLTISGGLSQSPYWTAKRPGFLGPVMEWRTV